MDVIDCIPSLWRECAAKFRSWGEHADARTVTLIAATVEKHGEASFNGIVFRLFVPPVPAS